MGIYGKLEAEELSQPRYRMEVRDTTVDRFVSLTYISGLKRCLFMRTTLGVDSPGLFTPVVGQDLISDLLLWVLAARRKLKSFWSHASISLSL